MPQSRREQSLLNPGSRRPTSTTQGEFAQPETKEAHNESSGQRRTSAWSADHKINLRLSLPFARYYLTVVAGRERRSAERLAQDRREHPLFTAGNTMFMCVIGILCGLAALAVIQLGTLFAVAQMAKVVVP